MELFINKNAIKLYNIICNNKIHYEYVHVMKLFNKLKMKKIIIELIYITHT